MGRRAVSAIGGTGHGLPEVDAGCSGTGPVMRGLRPVVWNHAFGVTADGCARWFRGPAFRHAHVGGDSRSGRRPGPSPSTRGRGHGALRQPGGEPQRHFPPETGRQRGVRDLPDRPLPGAVSGPGPTGGAADRARRLPARRGRHLGSQRPVRAGRHDPSPPVRAPGVSDARGHRGAGALRGRCGRGGGGASRVRHGPGLAPGRHRNPSVRPRLEHPGGCSSGRAGSGGCHGALHAGGLDPSGPHPHPVPGYLV